MEADNFLFAARLNAFRFPSRHYDASAPADPLALIDRAALVAGIGAVDCNYPDHLQKINPRALAGRLADHGLGLNGFAMRYYSDPAYRLGAFTHPDPAVRAEAIDLTRRGLDALREAGGTTMTLWLGQDGFDYPFQADYAALWAREIEGIRAACDHAPDVDISLEYKPNEPRAFALLPDVATTLLAVREVDRPNLGVTLDFAHVLYADEMPAAAAALVGRFSRLLGIHLNDGYGKRDDGLMVASVHPVQTVELLVAMKRMGYRGTVYFDTFPDLAGLDPVDECAANIATLRALDPIADRLAADLGLAAATARQDAVTATAIVRAALVGAGVPGGRPS